MTSPTLLVLGGTQWFGREVARQALERGYEVTCLARGESGSVPDGAALVRADRAEFGAYDEVAARTFDFAIEVSWEPRFVSEAVHALAKVVNHWTYLSTVAVYAESSEPNSEDSRRVEGLAWDDMAERRYAAAKVACEDVTRDARSGSAFLPRPGIIGGPGDVTDRLTYWPNRAALAGEGPLLAPDSMAGPAQVIDVRDLAAWVLDASAAGVTGAVNAVSPTYAMAEIVATARQAANHTGELVEASSDFLREHGVRETGGPGSLPLWHVAYPSEIGMGEHSWARYEATGGTCRPLADTVADVFAQERQLGIGRALVSGITRERELDLISLLRS